MAESGITVEKLLVIEYERLKEEQKSRIGFRDNLLYVTLAAVLTLLIGSAQTRQPALLLALPVTTTVLGWTYLMNDQMISSIGRYVRTDLGPRLGALAGESGCPFGWEAAHRSDGARQWRKRMQCAVDLLAFAVVPIAALVTFWTRGGGNGLTLAGSLLEALAVLVLAVQIVRYLDTSG
ncbi:hypothetical protein [Kitasatospora cineracea]|uniref:Integral membrane protein n=1 Tax=Kitasatospora cineracea TaxID=88074 RepID=A0A8G1XE77_9ACTN|nr:hypothetical protein [Kitasatospora cineracea]ROR45858.1 hypothetical protein EDD39_4108 [Kitasatospora cineracea]